MARGGHSIFLHLHCGADELYLNFDETRIESSRWQNCSTCFVLAEATKAHQIYHNINQEMKRMIGVHLKDIVKDTTSEKTKSGKQTAASKKGKEPPKPIAKLNNAVIDASMYGRCVLMN